MRSTFQKFSLVVGIELVAFASVPQVAVAQYGQAQTSTGAFSIGVVTGDWFGGDGGSRWGLKCTKIVSILGRAGEYIDSLGIRCTDASVAAVGGSGGGNYEVACPAGFVAYGIFGTAGRFVDSLGLLCRNSRNSEVSTSVAGGGGGSYFEYECPSGTWLSGFNIKRGAYLDAIQPFCN